MKWTKWNNEILDGYELRVHVTCESKCMGIALLCEWCKNATNFVMTKKMQFFSTHFSNGLAKCFNAIIAM